MLYRHETFQIFGRFQIFDVKIKFRKLLDFIKKIPNTPLNGDIGDFRHFCPVSDFCFEELSLMTVTNTIC